MTDIDQIDPAPWSRHDWSGEFISVDGCNASDFTREDVDEVLAWCSGGDRWDGETCGLVRLNDGRFAAWEASYGPTGDGFNCDAYGGDADIVFGRTAAAALSGVGEDSRAALAAMLERKP